MSGTNKKLIGLLIVISCVLAADKVYNLEEEVNSILTDKITNKDEPQFVWEANLMNNGGASNFVIDLNASESFFGVKKVAGKQFSDWGLSTCDGSGCTVNGDIKNDFSYWPSLYENLKNIPYVDADIVFRLSSEISYHKDSARLPIKLIGSTKQKSPFPEGSFGAIGFAPQGKFMNYLRTAYKWKADQVTIKINALKLDNTNTGFNNRGGIFNRNDFNFETVFPAPTVPLDITPPELSSDASNSGPRWRMPKTTMTIAKTFDGIESLTLTDSKDLCFTPRVNNFLTFYKDDMY